MPIFKLSYFNNSGLAEPIRKLLKYGQISFEDERFEMNEWPEIKSGMLTWADFYFVGLLYYFNQLLNEDLIEKYPNLQQVRTNVITLPGIKEINK